METISEKLCELRPAAKREALKHAAEAEDKEAEDKEEEDDEDDEGEQLVDSLDEAYYAYLQDRQELREKAVKVGRRQSSLRSIC